MYPTLYVMDSDAFYTGLDKLADLLDEIDPKQASRIQDGIVRLLKTTFLPLDGTPLPMTDLPQPSLN